MKTCKLCKKPHHKIVMVKRTCWLCVLSQWPPKTRRQYRAYENAVAIRLRLTTPIDNQKDALKVVQKIGIDNLLKVQAVIDGAVCHKPGNTFVQRLWDWL